MKRAASLREVALAAGVSLGTASQALRNNARTSKKTRDRIQALARSMGYRPNTLLARMATRRFRRTSRLGHEPVVFVTHAAPQFLNHGLRYMKELRERLESLGYSFRHVQVERRQDLDAAARQWYHQGVRGLIFGMFHESEWVRSVDWSAFSLVFLGGSSTEPVMHTVKLDAAQAMRRVLDEAQGRRAGVVLHRHAVPLADDIAREGVARVWAEQQPRSRRVPLLLEAFNAPWDDQQNRMRDWLKKYRPEVVVGFSVALFLTQGTPEEIPLERFLALSQDPQRGFRGVVEQPDLQAQRAVEWLDALIRHGETGLPAQPLCLLIPPIWSSGVSS